MGWASTTYESARVAFGARRVRHHGHLYSAPATDSRAALESSGMVLTEGATGFLRLLVSELKKPYPSAGDTVDLEDVLTDKWEPHTCLDVTPQQNGVTLMVTYGTQYAS